MVRRIIRVFCYCKLWYGVNVIGLPEVVGLYTEKTAKERQISKPKSKFHK